jgi:hypothetical protein
MAIHILLDISLSALVHNLAQGHPEIARATLQISFPNKNPGHLLLDHHAEFILNIRLEHSLFLGPFEIAQYFLVHVLLRHMSQWRFQVHGKRIATYEIIPSH